jgi:2-keto-3-deoxy-L-rhamnonate aldolase RhmA
MMSPLALRTVADAGFDWMLFDTEHGPLSIETVDARIRALKDAAALPIIRVVWNDVNAIKRALDTGAYGVVIPWVTTRDDAENAVRFCRYPPEGVRGVAPGRPAYVWDLSPEEYLAEANDELLVIVQIERAEAVANIEAILAVDGIDATFVGPSDLSASMGRRGQPFAPDVVRAMDAVVTACERAGVAPGIAYGQGVAHIRDLIAQGFRFIGVGGDTAFLKRGCRDVLARIKA